MTEIENDNIENMRITLIKRNNKDYLIVVGANKSRDFVIFLIQRSSNVYCNKYVLEDFAKINFFKIYLGFGFRQCIEIMIDLLKQKKDLINLEEEENIQIKLSLDIEIGVVGMNLNLPKERIEFLLKNHSIEQEIKNNLMWNGVLNLLQEKEDDQKKIKEQENKINQLTREQNIIKNEEKLKIHPYIGNNFNNINDLKQSKIISEQNIKSLDFVIQRLKIMNTNNELKGLNFIMLYSGKLHGDKSQKFHERCDNHKNTLVLIKTKSNSIFGGFAGKTWNSLEMGRKKDFKSFLFSIDTQRIYNPKLESKYHLFCSDSDGPCFYAFSINNNYFDNGGYCDEIYKCNYDSFEEEYELNKGVKYFTIEELEIYEVKYV
jgi:hypothetical protein